MGRDRSPGRRRRPGRRRARRGSGDRHRGRGGGWRHRRRTGRPDTDRVSRRDGSGGRSGATRRLRRLRSGDDEAPPRGRCLRTPATRRRLCGEPRPGPARGRRTGRGKTGQGQAGYGAHERATQSGDQHTDHGSHHHADPHGAPTRLVDEHRRVLALPVHRLALRSNRLVHGDLPRAAPNSSSSAANPADGEAGSGTREVPARERPACHIRYVP